MRTSLFVLVALSLLCACPPEEAPVVEEGLYVGVAVRDISPDDEMLADPDVYLGGYGLPFTRHPTGVHDAVNARAMAIVVDGSPLVLVVLDAPGVSNRLRAEIVRQVTAATGVDEERVLVGATHTHAGPDLQGVWGGVSLAYRSFVAARAAEAAIDAYASRREATLRATTGTAANRNRRGWDVTDDTFTIVEARARDGGDAIGAVVSFAAHPVVVGAGNRLVSRDFVGYAVDALDDALGAPVLYFNGIQGDVSPSCPDGDFADDFARAEACGLAYADVMAARFDALEPVAVDRPLVVDRVTWEQEVENALFKLAFDFADYDVRVAGSGDERRFFLTLGATTFTLGDALSGLAFPGEPLTRLGLPLKEALPGRFKLFLGLTTDAAGYFIPGDEWQTGRNDDYEEGVSLAESAGDRASAAIEGLLR